MTMQLEKRLREHLYRKAEEIEPSADLWRKIKREIEIRQNDTGIKRANRLLNGYLVWRPIWKKAVIAAICLLLLSGGMIFSFSSQARAWFEGAIGWFQRNDQPVQELTAELRLDKRYLRAGESLQFTIKNSGDTMIMFGEQVIIEKMVDGKWVEVTELYKDNSDWLAAGTLVQPGGTSEQKIDISQIDFSRGKPGHYRIGMEVEVLGAGLKKILYAEFELVEQGK